MSERGRREREQAELQAEEAIIAIEAKGIEENVKPKKPLKKARSEAELTRVRQGYLLITLNLMNVCIGGLIALKTFGII